MGKREIWRRPEARNVGREVLAKVDVNDPIDTLTMPGSTHGFYNILAFPVYDDVRPRLPDHRLLFRPTDASDDIRCGPARELDSGIAPLLLRELREWFGPGFRDRQTNSGGRSWLALPSQRPYRNQLSLAT